MTVANPSATLWSVPIRDAPVTEEEVKAFPVPSLNAIAPRFGGKSLFYLSSRGTGDGLWRYQDGQALEIWNSADGTLLERAAISPEGERALIVVRRSGKPRLHIVSADGATVQPIAPELEVAGTGSWSPDGKWIVIGASEAIGEGLFKIPVEGGPASRLTKGRAAHPVWSPNGRLIVYHGPEVAGTAPLLAVTPEANPVEMPPIRLNAWGERIRFVPNGNALVYMQRGTPSQDFWLLDLTTRSTRQLTRLRNSAGIRTFDVTTDGQSIVFDRTRENSDVVLIELAGSQRP